MVLAEHLMDEEFITRADLAKLLDYSCSLPTGTAVGKRWSRHIPYRVDGESPVEWMIGEYVSHPDPSLVGIKWSWAIDPETQTVHRGHPL